MVSYTDYTVSDLKELCRNRGYAVSGTKDDLVNRLRNNGNDPVPRGLNYENRTVDDLRDLCEKKGYKKSGTKGELMDRLRNPSASNRPYY
jgi:SAP domain-containing protein